MEEIITNKEEFKDLVHMIRGQQVMLDGDIAKLYGTEVKKLIQQVKRNIDKFPDDFMFQLIKEEELSLLKSQNVTSKSHGGKRKLSYAFTEQGIYMVATILKNDIATKQSIYIMRAFKEMRHSLAENKQFFSNENILSITNRLAKHEEDIQVIKSSMVTSSDLDKLMDNFIDKDTIKEKLFLNGQVFDASEAYIRIYQQAKVNIFIADDYINIDTLSLLKYKHTNVCVTIFTGNKGTHKLSKVELNNFNIQYPTLSINYTDRVHDRFIVIDYQTEHELLYVCGASSKDAGRRTCTITQWYDKEILHILVDHLLKNKASLFSE